MTNRTVRRAIRLSRQNSEWYSATKNNPQQEQQDNEVKDEDKSV